MIYFKFIFLIFSLLYIFAKFAKNNKTCMNSEKMRWHELPERCLMAVFMLLTVMLPARLQAADDDVVIDAEAYTEGPST